MKLTIFALLAACSGDPDDSAHSSSGETDTDTDTDTESPVGTGETATDTGDPPEIWPELLFDEDHLLVIPDGDGIRFLANDDSVVQFRSWNELVGDCPDCGGEGASADGDGLLLSFTTGAFAQNGAIGRVDGALLPDFRLDGFVFPHDAVRDPVDDTIIIPEATANRISWIAGDGSSVATVRALIAGSPGWDGGTPNGIDRFDYHGRSLMLSSHRGTIEFPPGFQRGGEITLWDITAAENPTLLWRYPSSGGLSIPHCPLFRRFADHWWLIYAHSEGSIEGSTVGIAVTDDPTVPPEYVADLVPTGLAAPFRFLRGVELTTDGWLYLTDSGGRAGFPGAFPDGRVLRAPMPNLPPAGTTGAAGSEQVFRDLQPPELLLDALDNPFEGWLWAPGPTFPR